MQLSAVPLTGEERVVFDHCLLEHRHVALARLDSIGNHRVLATKWPVRRCPKPMVQNSAGACLSARRNALLKPTCQRCAALHQDVDDRGEFQAVEYRR